MFAQMQVSLSCPIAGPGISCFVEMKKSSNKAHILILGTTSVYLWVQSISNAFHCYDFGLIFCSTHLGKYKKKTIQKEKKPQYRKRRPAGCFIDFENKKKHLFVH